MVSVDFETRLCVTLIGHAFKGVQANFFLMGGG